VDEIIDEHLLEAYMGGLKEEIKHEFFLKHIENIMKVMEFSCHVQANNKATHRSTIGAYACSRDRFGVHKTIICQLTRLMPKQMDERRTKVLCFNCDKKHSKGNKFHGNKLFYIDCEEEEDQ